MKRKLSWLLILALLALPGCGTQKNTTAESGPVQEAEGAVAENGPVPVAEGDVAESSHVQEAEGAVAETLPEETLPEETLPEDTLPQEAEEGSAVGRTAARPEAGEGFDEAAWELYSQAQAAMDALTAREEQFLVYTVQTSGETQTEESVDVRLKRIALDSEDPQFSAIGTVKLSGERIPLEMYYQDGVLYSISGTAKVKKAAGYAESVATVDILGEFSGQLKQEYISAISKTENADGTAFLLLSFHGNINGVDTSGSGELILNAGGYVISQKYDLTAEVEQDGVPASVRQSVECTVLSYGDSVTPIEFPAPEEFIEIAQP